MVLSVIVQLFLKMAPLLGPGNQLIRDFQLEKPHVFHVADDAAAIGSNVVDQILIPGDGGVCPGKQFLQSSFWHIVSWSCKIDTSIIDLTDATASSQ
jgi:hypothetical protein